MFEGLKSFYRQHPWIGWGCSTLSAVVSFIGLAGLPEDLSKWQSVLASNALTAWMTEISAEGWIRISLLFVGVVAFLAVNVLPVVLSRSENQDANDLAKAEVVVDNAKEQQAILAVLDEVASRGRYLIAGDNAYNFSDADFRAKSSVWLSEVAVLTVPSPAATAASQAKAAIASAYNRLFIREQLSVVVQKLDEYVAAERIKQRLSQASRFKQQESMAEFATDKGTNSGAT